MPKKKEKEDASDLFIGIDLGTSKTAVVSESGIKETLPSIVGWPKDMIAKKVLKKDILIGEDVLKNRLSLEISKPLSNGIINDNEKDKKAAKELLKHTLSIAKKGQKFDKVYAIVGAPAQTNHINKTSLVEICRDLTDSIMVVSEPFAVSYGIDQMNHSLIVDMGAGTIDLCRMHATIPEDGDEISLPKAGDHIDDILVDLVSKNYKGASIPRSVAQKWKEEYGFVGSPKERIKVEVPLDGKDTVIDITDEMKEACSSILEDLVQGIKGLISTYDSEFQPQMRANIYLAGRLSNIDGLEGKLKESLSSFGDVKIRKVEDTMFKGAEGALLLAKDMPPDYWEEVSTK